MMTGFGEAQSKEAETNLPDKVREGGSPSLAR